MSGGLARWSRRKLAAKAAGATDEKEAPPDAEPVGAALPEVQEALHGETQGEAEPLPRIEDLTAESDLVAFLKNGVPEALRSAAMRRIWSLNPAIRDHVGLAEYAWDFNEPGSMAGFGPLEAKEAVVNFLSTTIREVEKLAGMEPAAQNDAIAQEIGTPEAPAHPPDLQTAAAEPAAPAGEPEAQPRSEPDRPDTRAEAPGAGLRPRHGGALPR